MVKSSPADFAMAMLVKMAEMCVEANAANMDLQNINLQLKGKGIKLNAKYPSKK